MFGVLQTAKSLGYMLNRIDSIGILIVVLAIAK